MSPVAGIPFKSLKEFMNVFTPASLAALKGGKIMLFNVEVPTSAVLYSRPASTKP
ncbi:MAG: Uncharacterised protein [Flavobacteriaceae bacterium]|nr:MAG: Uncharacterised protein [Flavobacteriaceae bacterium]